MKITWSRAIVFAALSFAAGSWLTHRMAAPGAVQAYANRVYELRMYHVNPGRMQALVSRFRDQTRPIFDRHGISSVGYWVPQDSPAKDNLFVYVVSHPSREAAAKNWKAFADDPQWQKVFKETEASGKMVDHIDSTFM